MELQEKMFIEIKNGNKWELNEDVTEYNTETIFRNLANDLLNKKINGCLWISQIKWKNLMNGYQKIIVYYNNDVKRTYIVKNH